MAGGGEKARRHLRLAKAPVTLAAAVEVLLEAAGRDPIALCTLPWLGFVPDDVTSAPQAAVVRLAAARRRCHVIIGMTPAAPRQALRAQG
ncbi:hypothetical protein [Frankia sp. AgB32]|uniref:hypothetical protein n=1 Tax=Frankia sp. AgB32 TaxID=631119 RepID=UPI0020104427|nr:hypothetical protein [Frankia sp. AgB32]MCK9897702.1 hypothetical protein [Frankia sp. AgB32]